MNILITNTNIIELFRLKSVRENVYIEDAQVSVTITEMDGTPVVVEGNTDPWPLTLEYVSGSEGDYFGVLSDKAALEANTPYMAMIDADAGANRQAHWEIRFLAKIRNQ